MTNKQIKTLEDKLWASANSLRAYGGLKSADYAVPVLGLIFLKFADNKYRAAEAQILAEYQQHKGSRKERSIDKIALEKCGFYLPEESRYQHLLELPDEESMAQALDAAMKGIEKYLDTQFQDILPTQAYADIERKKDDILPSLIKAFADIPLDASGDVFGLIYEYFLGKFAMSEGQKGGQFFTPTSVVRFIVEVIEPYSGQIYDPACGSGGMFVQSAKFVREANKNLDDIYVYGQEFMGETVRLAKMNLLVNNIRGVIKEANSYVRDENHDTYGKYDFVMANPPFNVKSVKESTVAKDRRFYEYGLPVTAGKKDDRISDANYLWISLFATSLNDTGRAGFVMPNSASDARNTEKEIRKKMVDSGIVDVMVSMPSNMFITVTLPATLWFFDKAKAADPKRANKILFLDARNVYRQIDRAHRDWTADQQQNLAAIVRLYRGENERFTDLIAEYFERIKGRVLSDGSHLSAPQTGDWCTHYFGEYLKDLKKCTDAFAAEILKDKKKLPAGADLSAAYAKADALLDAMYEEKTKISGGADDFQTNYKKCGEATTRTIIKRQTELAADLVWLTDAFTNMLQFAGKMQNEVRELMTVAEKKLKIGKDKDYKEIKKSLNEYIEEPIALLERTVNALQASCESIEWLQKRFPEGKYRDVVGLCKIADKSDYAEEQDYSLNPGRYVGVEIEEDNLSAEEFKFLINSKVGNLKILNSSAIELENKIIKSLEKIL